MRKEKGSYDYHEPVGQWRWRGYYKDRATGKRERKYLYAHSKKELREKVERFLLEVDETGAVAKQLTFAVWVDIFLETVIADTVKIRTKEIYDHILKNHVVPVFADTKLNQFDALKFQAFLNEKSKKLSATTVATIRRYTIMCLDAAQKIGYINVNPLKATRPPRQQKKEIIALNKEQTDAIIECARAGDYSEQPRRDAGADYLRECYLALIITAIDTGMRIGEICGLRWKDVINSKIDSTASIVVSNALISAKHTTFLSETKTSAGGRKIIISERLKKTLENWREYQREYADKFNCIFDNKNKLVFTNSVGGFVSMTNFEKRCFRKIREKLNLSKEVTFHSLRHSHASQLLAAGVAPQIVSQRLGHSDLGVTLRVYAHALPNMQELAKDVINEVFSEKEGAEKENSITMCEQSANNVSQC